MPSGSLTFSKLCWIRKLAIMIEPASQLIPFLQETDELIAIWFTSIEAVKKKKGK